MGAFRVRLALRLALRFGDFLADRFAFLADDLRDLVAMFFLLFWEAISVDYRTKQKNNARRNLNEDSAELNLLKPDGR